MADSMTVSKARAALPQIIDRVLAGDEVTITRHGEPVAVIVRPDALRSRRVGDLQRDVDRIRALLASGRQAPLPARGTLSGERAEELVADIRAGRSRR